MTEQTPGDTGFDDENGVGPAPAGGPANIDADDEQPPPFEGDDDVASGHLGERTDGAQTD